MPSRELEQRLDVWMAEVDAFCTVAHERLDELEASGKEPMLDDESLDDLVSSEVPFYFSTDSLESELEIDEPQVRHRQLRLSLQVEPVEELAAPMDAIADVLGLAHAAGGRCVATSDLSGHTEDGADWIQRTAGGLEDRAG